MNAKGFPIVKLVVIHKGLYDGHDLKVSNLLIFCFFVSTEPPKLVVKFWASNLQLGSNYIDPTSPSLLLHYPLWPTMNIFSPKTRVILCAHIKMWKIIKYWETCESRTWCIVDNYLAKETWKTPKVARVQIFLLLIVDLGLNRR